MTEIVEEVFVFPASFSQQRLWLLDQLVPCNAGYNIPIAVRLTGDLNIAALERTFNEIIKRHEALRTTFKAIDGQPKQIVHTELSLAINVKDLSCLPKESRELEAQRLAKEEFQTPFDLSHAPLLRVSLLRLDEQEHIALLAMHHIISDGWSMGVLVHEMAHLYRAFVEGYAPSLPELPIQYGDFAEWQREWMQGEELEAQLSYWKTRLADAPPVLALPTDYPRPSLQSFRGAVEYFTISKRHTRALKELSRREGASLFMTLLSAYMVLLHRYTGQRDICVGTPVANRNRAELEPLIGFFINTLVIRAQIYGDQSFLRLLESVREACLGAYANQDVPFEKLVEELQPERNLSHQPLFQVMFAFQNTPADDLELPGLHLSHLDIHNETAKFDLNLGLKERNEELYGWIEFNSDLFERSTIKRMVQHFQILLEAVACNPAQRVCDLPLLTAEERSQIIEEWNDTKREYDQQRLIHQLFEMQVEREPNAVAAVFKDKQISYAQLNSQANRLAHHLKSLGMGPGKYVAVYMKRSLEMIPALLGVLKSGAAYVPIDTGYPASRVQYILSSLEIETVITQSCHLNVFLDLSDQLPALENLICLSEEKLALTDLNGRRIWTLNDLEKYPTANLPAKESSNDIAYIIFTSGSTGLPKGVVIRHKPVINLIEWFNREFNTGPEDRILFITSLCFDLSVYDIFGVLAAGGSIRIASEEELRDPERLVEALCNEPITLWDSAPAALQQLVPYFDSAKKSEKERSLRLLFLSGDWIPVSLPDQVRNFFKGARVIALGGATEATVWSNYYPVGEVNPRWPSIPYGKPIQNSQYHILDSYFNPLPVGVPGDLYIAGDCLAAAYVNDPELTARKFIPNPFSKEIGARMYGTGDLARYMADGNIEFLGRADQQVKIRGFRIELGEVEAVLKQHTSVGECVVLAGEDAVGKRLVAYVQPREEDGKISGSELRAFVKEMLPEYMVPSAFVVLDRWPVTPNGKLDRKALPAPEQMESETEAGPVEPRNEIERRLSDMWKEALGLNKVGLHDNFFEIGGHSLLATQLLAQMREAFGVALPLRTFFEAATIESLASAINAAYEASTSTNESSEPEQYEIEKWEVEGKPFMRELITRAKRVPITDEQSLLPIQPSGSKTPFFCVHAMSGSVAGYYELARRLGTDQPFYGLQAQGLNGLKTPCNSVEDMASHYVEAIRAICPSGPYALGGWSFGGLVAFEMARRLERDGQDVQLLALFDTRVPTDEMRLNFDYAGILVEMVESFTDDLKLSVDFLRGLKEEDQLTYVWEQLKLKRLIPPGLGFDWFRGYLNVYRANYEALAKYEPQEFSGRVTLFRAVDDVAGLNESEQDQTMGWSNLAQSGVDLYLIAGDHGSIINGEDVAKLAAQLEKCLNRVAPKC